MRKQNNKINITGKGLKNPLDGLMISQSETMTLFFHSLANFV